MRDAEPSSEENLEHSRNTLLAGTSVVSGEGRAVVFATGRHTEFGKIAHLTQITVKSVSPLQLEIARLSRIIAVLSLTLGVVFFFIGQSMGLSFWENFSFRYRHHRCQCYPRACCSQLRYLCPWQHSAWQNAMP